ncbi:SGNH/GDSL hydrolase family protein [Roseomonas marmotae]|uniref:SGNH/GDSL hydrolase family protein n=1 Tax=Roseomonas marmotae TaxID=2768161 RepID=A0ABS3KHX3_9PROT|nr:SGNH/GDSL hydrolase family protein [Roseomonas marmotae]MBO1075921.1 SGNH/GDSL hydrolase family protein [Roseomonas marmotae]QTI81896.1 SGNH/GDSL hydrolase family protein [Roseomonas marmotae]
MQSLLTGLSLLILGDSHFGMQNYLITTLQDELIRQGARVSTFAACGSPPSIWLTARVASCGTAQRVQSGPVIQQTGAEARTTPVDQLVASVKPNMIVVAMADTIGGYARPQMPREEIEEQVAVLTDKIRSLNIPCLWVGPSWGNEGGPFMKTFARVDELSKFMSTIVSPCTYVDSTKLAGPGQWGTFDGQHFTVAGYKAYGAALAEQIAKLPEVQAAAKR